MKKNHKFSFATKVVGGLLTTGLLTLGIVNSSIVSKTNNLKTSSNIKTLLTSNKTQAENAATTVDASQIFNGTNVTGKVAYEEVTTVNDVTQIKLVELPDDSLSPVSGTNLVLKTNFYINNVGPYCVTQIDDSAFEENANISGILDLSAVYTDTSDVGITSIGESAFSECTSITEIKLPSTVTTIGEEAFNECTNLISINLDAAASISTIGGEAFAECRSLQSIALPSALTAINEETFEDCIALTTLDISKCTALTTIGQEAFSGCTSLTTISFPAKETNLLSTIDQEAFVGCTSLGNLNLSSLDKLQTIGQAAFEGCSQLTNLTFPSGSTLTSIGHSAFGGCNLDNGQINLNNNENFHLIPFANGYAITSSETWTATSVAVGGLASGVIDLSQSTITSLASYAFYGSNITSLIMPADLTAINSYACMNCQKLTNLDFSLCTKTSASIGTNAFIGCSQLTHDNIVVPTDTSCAFKMHEIGNKGYSFGTQTWNGKNNAAGLLFGIINFSNVPGATSLTTTGLFAGCCGITGVITGSYLSSLPDEAFQNCVNLREVELSAKLTSVGEDAFEGCPLSLIVSNSTSLPLIQFYDGDTIVGGAVMGSEEDTISSSWDENSVTVGCLAYGKIVLNGNSLFDTIAEEAFANCDGITSVKLIGIKSIGEEAFEKCDNLSSVTFDDSLISIEEGAFNECPKLQEITIPSSVKLVDSYAFGDCSSLTDITFKNKNPDWMTWSTSTTSNGNQGMSSQCFTGLVEKGTTVTTTGGISPIKNVHVPSGSEKKYQEFFENNPSQFNLWYTSGAIDVTPDSGSSNNHALALGLGIGLGGAALIGLVVGLSVYGVKKKKKTSSNPNSVKNKKNN